MKKNKKRWKLALALVGIIIFLMWPKATSFTKKSIQAVIAPTEETTSNISRKFITFGNAIRGIGSSAEREQQLSLELVRAQSELNRLKDIEIENQRLLEALGFQQIAPYTLTPAIVVNRNISGWWSTLKIKPSNNDKIDINKAIQTLANLGKYNFSQGTVVRDKKVIAIEKKGGTEQMLIKCKSKNNKKGGVLVKFPKKKQDLRIDLPTVGLKTLKQCCMSGLKGIVLKNKQNIFLDKNKCIDWANKNKMFITVK